MNVKISSGVNMEKKDDILAAMETLSGKERMNTLCAEIDKHIKKKSRILLRLDC